jgi:hypothetical protein
MQQDFDVRILEFQGKEIDPAPSLRDAGNFAFYDTRVDKAEYFRRIQEFGQRINSGSPQDQEVLRAQFESVFLAGPVTYEVVRLTFNPIERWKNGSVQESLSLGQFITQGRIK